MLASSALGGVLGVSAARRKSLEAWKWSRWMSYAAFFAMSLAIGLMEYALITHDFSVSYVAEVGSTTAPCVILASYSL